MENAKNFTKEDLKSSYDQYFDQIKGFLYYKTGDIGLAEDLVQDVFLKVWEKRNQIKKETIKSLLFTMANNLMINHFNHHKVVAKHEDTVTKRSAFDYQSPQFIYEEKEFEIKFNAAIEKLPEGCREVFLMNRIDKLKYEEIAERLELSVKAIEKRMSKAISILKEQLDRKL